MRRREFITLVGAAAAARPFPAGAQQADRVRRVGVLTSFAENDPVNQARVAAFQQTIEMLGWSEGRNIRTEYRFAAGQYDQFQRLAKDMVALQPDVILAQTTPIATALQRETRTIPIVFVYVSDPVGAGLITSLARPGGNFTGMLLYEQSIAGKWLEMLKEIAPRLARAAFLANPKSSPYSYFLRYVQAAAPGLAIELVPSPVASAADIERTVELFAREPNGGLLLPPDQTTISHRDLIVALAAQHNLPAVYFNRTFVAAGGLISYGTDLIDQHRRAASYVDRILKGEKPSDLPVQAPTKYETCHQLEDSEVARPRRAADAARPRRRGHRITALSCCGADV